MSTEIKSLRQTLRVPGTTKITVSAKVDGESPGQRLRAIRVYTDDDALPALELQVEGASDDAISFTTPELEF